MMELQNMENNKTWKKLNQKQSYHLAWRTTWSGSHLGAYSQQETQYEEAMRFPRVIPHVSVRSE